MRLKEIKRTAAVSWCPVAPFTNYMVCGSIAGSLTDFSAQPKLEIVDTSYRRRRHATGSSSSSSGGSLVVGSVTTSERFTKVAWSGERNATVGSPGSTEYLNADTSVPEKIGGLIAGALVNGSIGIWDPRVIAGHRCGSDGEDEIDLGMIAKLDKHTAAVKVSILILIIRSSFHRFHRFIMIPISNH